MSEDLRDETVEEDTVEFESSTEQTDQTQSDAAEGPVVDDSTAPRIEETACSNCGAPIGSDATVCPDCGAEQGGQTEQAAETDRTKVIATSGESEQSGKDVEPLFSAIISFFFPGLGHVYHGQSERGIVIFAGWIGWWLVLGALFFLLTVLTLGLGIVTIFLLPVIDFFYHVVAAVDAYVQCEKVASGEK